MLSSIVLKNQFGEVSNNFIKTGSSAFLWCNFVVDATNGNGLGIRSLKSSGLAATPDIAKVYMHTSATAAAGNPNPQVGIILVEFAKSFSGYINGASGVVVPVSGSTINVTAGLTLGNVYIIVSVGTTNLAAWQALGWLGNALPTVGAAFVAITASDGTGTGIVEVPAATGSSVGSIQGIGDPNQTCIASTPTLICGVYGPTSDSVTTPLLVAPANNTVIGLTFNMINIPKSLI